MQVKMNRTERNAVSDIPVSFRASNITGTQSVPVEVNGGLSVRSVADSIAARMALPDDVAWALRDDDSSTYLDESRPIGSQIGPGARVTITPQTHLGGAPVAGH
jgi:hypothetical protein